MYVNIYLYCKLTGCRFDPHSKKRNIYLNLYFISSLWCRGKERCGVSPLNTQCLQNSAEMGERRVLALGSLPTLPRAGYSVKLIF